MDDVWHGNEPCDRVSPLEWASVIGLIVAGTLGLPAYFLRYYLGYGGSPVLAVIFAALTGIFGCYMLLLAALTERDRAVSVSLQAGGLTWQTRSGKTRSVSYSRIIEVLPWPRWAAAPPRHIVVFQVGRYPPREGVWLNDENKKRLIEAMHKPMKPSGPNLPKAT